MSNKPLLLLLLLLLLVVIVVVVVVVVVVLTALFFGCKKVACFVQKHVQKIEMMDCPKHT